MAKIIKPEAGVDVTADFPATSVIAGASSPATSKTKERARIIYLGPTFVEDGVPFEYGKVFNNGLPQPWKDMADKDADFRMMLVSTDKMGPALTECGRAGSPRHIAMGKIRQAHLGKGARKGKKGE